MLPRNSSWFCHSPGMQITTSGYAWPSPILSSRTLLEGQPVPSPIIGKKQGTLLVMCQKHEFADRQGSATAPAASCRNCRRLIVWPSSAQTRDLTQQGKRGTFPHRGDEASEARDTRVRAR